MTKNGRVRVNPSAKLSLTPRAVVSCTVGFSSRHPAAKSHTQSLPLLDPQRAYLSLSIPPSRLPTSLFLSPQQTRKKFLPLQYIGLASPLSISLLHPTALGRHSSPSLRHPLCKVHFLPPHQRNGSPKRENKQVCIKLLIS